MILSFTPRLTIIPTHVETNQCTYRYMISHALRHAPATTQKRCDQFMFISITMHVQMHVHNDIKFSHYVVINV